MALCNLLSAESYDAAGLTVRGALHGLDVVDIAAARRAGLAAGPVGAPPRASQR
jgi:hypothetical protein